MTESICLIPGDGIGQEVVPAAAEILAALNLGLTTETHPAGWECFQQSGRALPAETLAALQRCGVVLFGATNSPSGSVPGYRSPILELRQKLNLYANLRPVQSLPGNFSRPNIDLLIVRENTEGLYGRRERWEDEDTAIAERVITRAATEKIARKAIRQAQRRRGHLTITHKANVLRLTDGLFRQVVRDVVEAEAPELHVVERLVDTLAHDLVLTPEHFDVIVAPNLYGDILSDLASALVGGLGVAPSANIGDNFAIYEPVHGSAPDIAGQGSANPTAVLLSLAMMLDDLGYPEAAKRIRAALHQTLAASIRPRDLNGSATTREMIEAVKERL